MQPVLLLALLSVCSAASIPHYPSGGSSSGKDVFAQLQQTYERNLAAQLSSLKNSTGCTRENISVRRSWSALNATERTDYLKAVGCLYSKPNRISNDIVPGARNRLDDFTYSHINQTNFIHVSGLLFPWHRQFVWAYEQALREECGYKGSLAYWDWSEYAGNQSLSPVFDGSATSFGSNGQYVPHSATNSTQPGLPVPLYTYRPPGTGGGCITSTGGLPSNFTLNIGPVSPVLAPANNNTYGLDYNPRCMKRDILPSISEEDLGYNSTGAIMLLDSIHTFHPQFEVMLHKSAHESIGGDLFDLFSSPTDPAFFLLHGQVDRLWSIWQGQNYTDRAEALDGTVTFANDPPSANATLDTVMHMFEAGGDMPIAKAMSTFENGYCYMYQ